MHRHWAFSLLVVSVLLVASPARAQVNTVATGDEHAAATQAAQEAAQGWLRHVDSGAWATAWDELAPGLRDTVSQEQWRKRGSRARSTLGTSRSRQITRAQYRDTLGQSPGAGPAVVLKYHSTFGANLYVETILTLRTDEAWRVAGYEIAPVAGRSK